MKPKQREFEKVQIDEWIMGFIEEVQHEENHEFTGQFARIAEAVRFKLKLEGYNDPKYTPWLSFLYSERSTLFSKYIKNFVQDAYEYFDFDIDLLKGLRIKIMYTETTYNGKPYQNILKITAIEPIKFIAPIKPRPGREDIKIIQLEDIPTMDVTPGEETPF